MTVQNIEAEKLRAELIARANMMSGTEFSVKAQKLRSLGGYWPNSLSDWSTPEGMALSREIKAARGEVV